jgi:hypothetical protein
MSEPDHRKKVAESLEVAREICSEWECNFLGSVSRWKGEYTVKQKETIDKIYKKVCESGK